MTPRVVAVGGGHGLSRTLRALRSLGGDTTAVVTVADDGGSSGRLRRDLDVIPPGDLRMALAALAEDRDLADLLQYRFDRGELEGHSLGNLILVGLRDLAGGDMVSALDRAADLLGVAGRVLPCTRVPLVLRAASENGLVTGQASVTRTARLRRVWIEPPDVAATPEAVKAIDAADLIVLGPGSLYTSLIPNLLVPDIATAVAATPAPVVLVANLRDQVGETEGMTLVDHLVALSEHVPEVTVDVLVAHGGPAPAGRGRPLRAGDAVERIVDEVVTADLLDGSDGHEPVALARVLEEVLRTW